MVNRMVTVANSIARISRPRNRDYDHIWYDNHQFKTKVMASMRNPQHVVEAAKLGAAICIMLLAIFKQLMHHRLTDFRLKKFLTDWEKQSLPET